MGMGRSITPKLVYLTGFEIIYSDSISYGGKEHFNVAVKVELNIDGHVFTRTEYMYQTQVSKYLNKYGAEL